MSPWVSATCLGLAGVFVLSACDTDMGRRAENLARNMGSDSCGAIRHQNLVGRTTEHLNVTELPRNTRVVPVGSSAGQIGDERRMTVIIGSGNKVSRVYCG